MTLDHEQKLIISSLEKINAFRKPKDVSTAKAMKRFKSTIQKNHSNV